MQSERSGPQAVGRAGGRECLGHGTSWGRQVSTFTQVRGHQWEHSGPKEGYPSSGGSWNPHFQPAS